MTLYQTKWNAPGDGTGLDQDEYDAWMEFRALVEKGYLVPLVGCGHGPNRINGHYKNWYGYGEWCPGAGIDKEMPETDSELGVDTRGAAWGGNL